MFLGERRPLMETPTTLVAARVRGTNLLLVAVSARGVYASINNCLIWETPYRELNASAGSTGTGYGSGAVSGEQDWRAEGDGDNDDGGEREEMEKEEIAGAQPRRKRGPECSYLTDPTELSGLGTCSLSRSQLLPLADPIVRLEVSPVPLRVFQFHSISGQL